MPTKTKISDVIVPEVFAPYFIQESMEKSAIYQSGIISNDPKLDVLATAGGRLINMPFWDDLTGADEVLSDTGALTPKKIVANQDVAALFMRGSAWSANDLAKALSGDDPMGAIGSLVANYWSRRYQKLLLSILKGIFGTTELSATNSLDISSLAGDRAMISASAIIDGTQKLGDAKDSVTAMIVHSATEAHLAKQDLIETIRDSEGKILYKTYMDKRLIVDDGCPVVGGVYSSYFFGQGAFGLGNGNAPVPVETDRDSLGGDDYLITRHHFVLHPRGIKFTDANVAESSPSNAEAADSTNWKPVYEPKAIRMLELKHKLGV